MAAKDRAFQFIRLNQRDEKPRKTGVTEIRGPYYSVMGTRYLQDVLDTMGEWIDSLKFAGGSFTLMPREQLEAITSLCHDHDVLVSTEDMAGSVAEATGLTEPEYRLPGEALESLPSGATIFWQVEATTPEGGRIASVTFVTKIE